MKITSWYFKITCICAIINTSCQAMSDLLNDLPLFRYIEQNIDWQKMFWLKEPLTRFITTLNATPINQLSQTELHQCRLTLTDSLKKISIARPCIEQFSIVQSETEKQSLLGALSVRALKSVCIMIPSEDKAPKEAEQIVMQAMHLIVQCLFDYVDETEPLVESVDALTNLIIEKLITKKLFPADGNDQTNLRSDIHRICAHLFEYARQLHDMLNCLRSRHPAFEHFSLKGLRERIDQPFANIQKIYNGTYIDNDNLISELLDALSNECRQRDPSIIMCTPQGIGLRERLSFYALLLEAMNQLNRPRGR